MGCIIEGYLLFKLTLQYKISLKENKSQSQWTK